MSNYGDTHTVCRIYCTMSKTVNKTYAVIAVTACAALVIFSSDCMYAALTGFDLWLSCVMPSIFPFFVCISFMRESGLLAVRNGRFTMPLFLSCALGGAPSGSKLCADLADNSLIERNRLTEYCAVCNMVSPTFITGTLANMNGSSNIVLPILIGHYLSAFLMLIFLNLKNRPVASTVQQPVSKKRFFDVLCNAVSDGVISTVQICGVIIFFSVLLTIFLKLSALVGIDTLHPVYLFIMSLIEMTNGASMIFAANLSFAVMCALLAFVVSFGGLCIMVQAAQVAPINPKKYLIVKLIAACMAGMIAFISANLMPSAQPVFLSNSVAGIAMEGGLSIGVIALSSLIGCGCIWLMSTTHGKHRTKSR